MTTPLGTIQPSYKKHKPNDKYHLSDLWLNYNQPLKTTLLFVFILFDLRRAGCLFAPSKCSKF
ncbi:hypothetical protein B0189_04460 [Moraxella cuniculi]|nr:hypothetical protein B0189_04460 [Moraxella cuniculi]